MAQDNVQRIKDRLDIVDVIGQTVQLRRAGRSFKGLCPFHQEKTPSFVVYPDSQSYHCFGCQKNGDILSFAMDTENLTFRDALERLAERAGIELKQQSSSNPERDERRNRLVELHERAVDYFASTLWNSSAAIPARELVEQRGIDRRTAEKFGLGFAPDSWDSVKTHLQQSLNVDEGTLVDAGLCSKADSGRVYDRFRNRLMFPIRDRKGRPIGFGARSLGDEMPKYLNSPQTTIFDKSNTLYALDLAFEDIRKTRTLVVVEGYMDAIAAHQYEFKNVVASMGTALTESQVSVIRSYVDHVYVALDSDAAGQLATVRAIETLREGFADNESVTVDHRGLIRTEQKLGAEIRVMRLDEGKDPDDLIRADPNLWIQSLESAIPLVEYVLRSQLNNVENSPAARADALRNVAVPVLREIRDEIVQSQYIDMTSDLLGLKESIVRQAIRAPRRSSTRRTSTTGQSPEITAFDPEQVLVALLLAYPLGYASRAGTIDLVNRDLFRDARHREIFVELQKQDLVVDQVVEQCDEGLTDYIQTLRASKSVRADLTPGMANNEILQAIDRLHQSRYQEMVRQTQDDIRLAREEGDTEQLKAGVEKMAELARDKAKYAPRVSPYFHDLRSSAK